MRSVLIDSKVKAVFQGIAEFITYITEQQLRAFLAVLAPATSIPNRRGDIIIPRPLHAAGAGLVPREAKTADFRPDVQLGGVVTSERNKIDGTAQSQAAILQGVLAAVNFGVFKRPHIEVFDDHLPVAPD